MASQRNVTDVSNVVPVVVFVYRRTKKLATVLQCLRRYAVPLSVVFSDAPADRGSARQVEQVRQLIRSIGWCREELRCRRRNMGLGRNIRDGVRRALEEYERAIVIEDDIECTLGMYAFMVGALETYSTHHRVMSVGRFSHPRLRPSLPDGGLYFDGRCACWG